MTLPLPRPVYICSYPALYKSAPTLPCALLPSIRPSYLYPNHSCVSLPPHCMPCVPLPQQHCVHPHPLQHVYLNSIVPLPPPTKSCVSLSNPCTVYICHHRALCVPAVISCKALPNDLCTSTLACPVYLCHQSDPSCEHMPLIMNLCLRPIL